MVAFGQSAGGRKMKTVPCGRRKTARVDADCTPGCAICHIMCLTTGALWLQGQAPIKTDRVVQFNCCHRSEIPWSVCIAAFIAGKMQIPANSRLIAS